MPTRLIRQLVLYFFAAVFLVIGLVGLFAPAMLILRLHLMPVTLAGLGEMRGLYGGGFLGFGVVILAGLRCKATGPGLLLAMSIIFTGIVVGRLFSLVFDHDFAFAIPSAISEAIFAACCYYESRHGLARA